MLNQNQYDQSIIHHSAFSFSSSSKYENSLHESKLYLQKQKEKKI